MKITKQLIRDLGKPDKETWIWDSTMPGFGLRVWPSGRAIYVLRYRTKTRTQRKITIGDARAMHPDEARDRARMAIVSAADGGDPQMERQRERNAETIDQLFNAYLEYQGPHLRQSSLDSMRKIFDRYLLPEFGKTRAAELDIDKLARWHARQERRASANQAIRYLSAAYTWAVEIVGWLPRNPLRKFRYFKQPKRQIILRPDQLRALLAELDRPCGVNWACPYLIKMLLLTGLRLNEWACAEWGEYNEAAQTLTLAEERSKTGARTVQLGEEAVTMLAQIRSHPSAHPRWIFPNFERTGPLSRPYKYWYEVIERVEIPNLRLHDLRHTYASYSLMGGATLREVQEMLGHRKIETTSRYVGVFDEAVQRAQTRASRAILNVAVTGRLPTGDVTNKPMLAVVN